MSERYFVPSPIVSSSITLSNGEAHHLLHVMRARPGTEIVLFDGSGAEFRARVESVGRTTADLAILSRAVVDRESRRTVVLGAALPKGDRQRWLVEKCVELGVARLVPLVAARGVAQPVAKALDRLRRTAIEAAKQCGRNLLMEIAPSQSCADFLAAAPRDTARVVAHPSGESRWLDAVRKSREVWMAVGPEGGFREDEIDAARQTGWRIVSLGPRILRVETAAMLLSVAADLE